jgi:uncharacterized protein
MNKRRKLSLACFALGVAVSTLAAQAPVRVDTGVAVLMRDGVVLRADLYRPAGDARFPVLVHRTPYGRTEVPADPLVLAAVRRGYAVVLQDVRGRYGSDGEFEPNVTETSDGVDVIAWSAAQPWSSGVVGTFGGSYLGGTQWLPARQNPPALKAMAPAVTFSDMHEGCCYQGGANVLHSLRWVVEDIAPAEFRRRAAQNPAARPADVELDLYTTLNELPLGSNPLIRDAAPFYLERLAHPTPGDYWLAISPNSGYEQISALALNIGGWYDIFQWGTLQNFQNMRRRGSDPARAHQRVIIGPWTHTDFSGSFPTASSAQPPARPRSTCPASSCASSTGGSAASTTGLTPNRQ